MPDDKPNPFDDVRKGLGLLFRAAKTTLEKLPTKDLEEVVVTSAREVGRAIENVGKTLEREVMRNREAPHERHDRPSEEGDETHPSHNRPDEPADGKPKPPDAGC